MLSVLRASVGPLFVVSPEAEARDKGPGAPNLVLGNCARLLTPDIFGGTYWEPMPGDDKVLAKGLSSICPKINLSPPTPNSDPF